MSHALSPRDLPADYKTIGTEVLTSKDKKICLVAVPFNTMKKSSKNWFCAPLQKWHGRSWSRCNLHHSIHQSRQLVLADQLPVTFARPHPGASAPSPLVTSPTRRALPSSPTKAAAQRPLPHALHSSLPSAHLTEGPSSSASPPAASSPHSAHQQPSTSGPARRLRTQAETSRQQASSDDAHLPHASASARGTAPAEPAVVAPVVVVTDCNGLSSTTHHQDGRAVPSDPQQATAAGLSDSGSAAAAAATAATEALQHDLQLPNGNSAILQQARHQQSAVGQDQDHRARAATVGQGRSVVQPASAKDLQNGLLQPMAPWDDADPDLVKQARALGR